MSATGSAPRSPHATLLADGCRLHLQDGPIDLIIEAFGPQDAVAVAYAAAHERLVGLLDLLCEELTALRARTERESLPPKGAVARRMFAAVYPYAAEGFITPMAAVAGSVADDVLAAMLSATGDALSRAYVNNGGDIALHLAPGERFIVGLVDRPDQPGLFAKATISAEDGIGGIATSGARGRSFSLGIADAVTILARDAARADAAATVVANAVDVEHPDIIRQPARDLQPDNDLGDLRVTRFVPRLEPGEVEAALGKGVATAERLCATGEIIAAALHLQGITRTVGRLGQSPRGHALNAP